MILDNLVHRRSSAICRRAAGANHLDSASSTQARAPAAIREQKHAFRSDECKCHRPFWRHFGDTTSDTGHRNIPGKLSSSSPKYSEINAFQFRRLRER